MDKIENIREYTADEEFKTFEKIALNFKYSYKDKNYNFIITAPLTNRKYELNLMLMDQMKKKIQKFFYTFYICKKKTKINKLFKISAYIHALYLMGCNDLITVNKDYIFKKMDYELPYRIYEN